MYKNLKWCCTKQIKPMYNNIKYKDYFEPIKRYSNDNDDIFNDIIKKKEINDYVMQYYIKSSIDISIIIIYPNALKYPNLVDKLINKLEKNGDIHYIKDIEINYFMAYNMSYQLYSNEERMKNNSSIQYKIERIGFINNDTIKTIKIIVYTLTNKEKQINGKSAEFKMELRDIFVQEDIKTTPYKPEQDQYPRGYDYLHISDNNNQSYEYAGMFFHENSLKFLKKQKTWRLLNMYKTQKLMNLTKDFFYDYSLNEFEKLMIFSSGVLFTYGIREANDIDCILLENNVIKPIDIEIIMNKNIDITYKGTKEYNQQWEDELNNRAQMFNAKDYKELITNPKYYYYFMGFKIIRLKFDLILRFKRNRPAQFTDLLVIRQMFNFGYKLKLPKTNITFNKKTLKDEETVVNKDKYLDTIKWYLETRYYISITKDQVEQWINMNFNEESNDDPIEYYSDLNGGTNTENAFNFITSEDESNNKYIYHSQVEILKQGYEPNIIIYSSDKPYLYPGENFEFDAVVKSCTRKINEIKPKRNTLRIASFNLHNFISRCNQGIAPLFGTALNPFSKSKDIKKFIDLFKRVDADIYCFQELVPITEQEIKKDITDLNYIRNNFNFKYFNELMENIGYKYKIIGSTQNGKFYDLENRSYYYLANGIYSKIKLNNPEIYNFTYLNRNIITAEVTFNNKNIRIFNTHLEYYETTNKNLLDLGYTNNHVIQQFKDLQNLIDHFKNNNSIICGDFNINIFNKHVGFRFRNWEEKTEYIRNNYNNGNRFSLPTNFSQQDQTDFIIFLKNSNISVVHSFIVLTNISDHYMIFCDFL
jgi:endonuclease/exonuclease/phosphatase family metal-dependent hydrolase